MPSETVVDSDLALLDGPRPAAAGRHRMPRQTTGGSHRRPTTTAERVRPVVMVATILSAAPIVGAATHAAGQAVTKDQAAALPHSEAADLTRKTPDVASRSAGRGAGIGKPTITSKGAAPVPEPVAGLSQQQMANATTIVRVGQQMGLPRKAYLIAIATAMQESDLRNMANDYVPESFNCAYEGVGADHDSVGLFQQRPSADWGSVQELMNKEYASRAFYNALKEVSGWQYMAVTVAAQRVQGSAFPDAYAKHEGRANTIVSAIAG